MFCLVVMRRSLHVFYDKLLTRLDPDLMELVKFSRQERARLQADDNTRDRLEVKETREASSLRFFVSSS